MKHKILVTVITFLFVSAGNAQDNSENLIKVKDNIYMYQKKGGNIGLSFGEDGVFMIDDQFVEGIPEVLEAIKSISNEPVEFLINTHHHGDHTGGNAAMAKTGTTIFSQQNVRKRLLSSEKTEKVALPIVTFSEDITFHYNANKIFIFHVHNAHTDGDAIVYFMDTNVLHTGDVFFNGRYPYIDTKNGGSVEGYIKALEKIAMVANEDTMIIPGHGDIGNVAGIKYSANMLKTIKERVNQAVNEGKSIDKILKMKELTAEFDAKDYGGGFISTEKILTVIYEEVSEDKK